VVVMKAIDDDELMMTARMLCRPKSYHRCSWG
jgi:hypothetical protein